MDLLAAPYQLMRKALINGPTKPSPALFALIMTAMAEQGSTRTSEQKRAALQSQYAQALDQMKNNGEIINQFDQSVKEVVDVLNFQSKTDIKNYVRQHKELFRDIILHKQDDNSYVVDFCLINKIEDIQACCYNDLDIAAQRKQLVITSIGL